jgi:outer membrane protein
MVRRATLFSEVARRVLRSSIFLCRAACLVLASLTLSSGSAAAESLTEALVKAYQNNPQLNSERARQRATDENVPQALAGYRPQIVASLSSGL